MISGMITVFPKFGKETYIESKTKQQYRHLPCVTHDGLNIHITVTEELYKQHIEVINSNDWGEETAFRVWGEVKSVNEITDGYGLSNLYIRVDRMELETGVPVNVFSLNGHGTKTSESHDGFNLHWIAANKNILNQEEKKNKPAYCYLKTKNNVIYEDKDIIQGNVKLISIDGTILLESIHTTHYTACRKLVKFFLPQEQAS